MSAEMENYKSENCEIKQVEVTLGDRPREAIETIDYLNNISNKQLEDMELTNRTQVFKTPKHMISNNMLYKVMQNNTNILEDDI